MSMVNVCKVVGVAVAVVGTVYLASKYCGAFKKRHEVYRAKQLQVGYALKQVRDRINKKVSRTPLNTTDYDRQMWKVVNEVLDNDLSDCPLERLEFLVEWAKSYDQKLNLRP